MLNHEVNQMNYKLLHEKFERRKQWLIFEKEEVVRRVMVRYKHASSQKQTSWTW